MVDGANSASTSTITTAATITTSSRWPPSSGVDDDPAFGFASASGSFCPCFGNGPA